MKKVIALLILAPSIAIAALLVGSAVVTVTTTPQIIDTSNRQFPITVSIVPQAGTAGTIEFSNSINAAAASGVANWQVLGSASNVSVATTVSALSPFTALRFTRVSGASAVTGEVSWNQ